MGQTLEQEGSSVDSDDHKGAKKYECMEYLMATVLKARANDRKSVKRVLGYTADDPRQEKPTIAKLPSKSTKDLVTEKLSKFKK